MFTPVKRWKRILVQVLVTAQLLSAAPFASADIPDADLPKALTDAGYDVKGISRTQRPMVEVRAEIKQAAQ